MSESKANFTMQELKIIEVLQKHLDEQLTVIYERLLRLESKDKA